MRNTLQACAVALCLAAGAGRAAEAEPLRNWFDDPFVQLSSQLPGCPLPAGPNMTARERDAQSHRRLEKGTTAWLAGHAERHSAYAYDAEIARALREASRHWRELAGTSLWATVQGRVVYLEGCVGEAMTGTALEARARAVAHVEQAVAIVRRGSRGKVPYRLMPAAR